MNPFLLQFLFLFIFMNIVWLFSYLKKNPGIVDFSWSIGLMLSGLIYLTENLTYRNLILGALLILWAVRLGCFIYFDRIKNNIVEKRYASLIENWKMNPWISYYFNFQFQGILIFLMTVIFYLSAKNLNQNLSNVDIIGVLLAGLGTIFELVSDAQLKKHKQSFTNEICETGFWYYSRHPNLYFDWLTWCGFSLFAYHSPYGLAGIISPITLYIIMNYMTLPTTERMSVKSRGEKYLNYQKTTSKFFIWFKRD
jgi:steroid 5-alpha reductase family enzyme